MYSELTKTSPGTRRIDLSSWRPLRALIRWQGFPYVFQAALLAAGIALAVNGWDRVAPKETVRFFGKTNATTLLIWGLWWPAMIWCAVLLGRVWCMVCPLELLGNLAQRSARRVGFPQRQLPRWIASGALIVVMYTTLQFVIAGEVIIRVPAYTSILLLVLASIALFAGWFFRDRAVCRGFCPIGELLGTYGRGGMLAVRAESGEPCQDCSGRECVAGANRHKWHARSCPSLLNPLKLTDSRECLICTQCIKSCDTDNIRLILRPPFDASDSRPQVPGWSTTFFVMLVSGFVCWELSTEWSAAEKVFLSVPEYVSHVVGVPRLTGYFNGLWALAVVPLLLWSILGGLFLLGKGAPNLTAAWRLLTLPMAVVVSTGHMARGIAKFTSWAAFLPFAVGDPSGTAAAVAMAKKEIARPAGILSMPIVSILGGVVVVCGLLLAWREAALAHPEGSTPYRVPLALLACLYLCIIAGFGVAGS